ncbi:Elongation factor 4 [Fagus crenata]
MWRCKWIELQIRELQSQALKYDGELAAFDERKQFEFERFTLEDFDAKSLPFSSQIPQNKVMKRKKRKRVESTIDIASYMSQPVLLLWSFADRAPMEDNCGNLDKVTNGNNEFEINYGWPSLEFGNGDNSFEQILRKIEVTHLQVHKLKTQIDKVISENPGKFSSMNQLSLLVPCDALTSSDQIPVSPPEIGHSWPSRSLCAASQHVSECNMGDVLMPESAVLSHGEVTPLPNLMDSMPPFGGLCTNAEQEILIHNQAAEEELDDFIEKPQVPMED